MGVDIIVLTGNPGNGVTNHEINLSLKELKAAVVKILSWSRAKCMLRGVK